MSFLVSAVALARLVSVFSKLVRWIWRAVSSLAGPVGWVLLWGSRAKMRGSCRKSDMMWALAAAFSSPLEGFAGCMCFKYARQRPSMDERLSWLAGRSSCIFSPGMGRKEGRRMVLIGGMVVVQVQGVMDSHFP